MKDHAIIMFKDTCGKCEIFLNCLVILDDLPFQTDIKRFQLI